MSKHNNPLSQPDSIEPWIAQDSDYVSYKLMSRANIFQTLDLNSNPIMSPSKLFTYITKHALISSIVAILALTTISVAAAQALAPEQYKPSTLLGITKKTDEPKVNSTTPQINEVKNSQPTPSQPTPTDTVNQKSDTFKYALSTANGTNLTGLNVRTEPCGQVIGSLQRWNNVGDLVSPTPQKKECNGTTYDWYNIKWEDGTQGWSIADNLKLLESKPFYDGIKLVGASCRQNSNDNLVNGDVVCDIVNSISNQKLATTPTANPIGIFTLGKQYAAKQYIAYNWGSGLQGQLIIYEFSFETKSLLKVGEFRFTGCSENPADGPQCSADDKAINILYENAIETYTIKK